MPPEPRHVPVSPSPEFPARQRLHIHGIREMPAGYDAEVAELFRDLRSASNLTESDLAARLATRVEVVQALEQGALYALPPWAETCRVVNGYGAMLNLDVRPLLRRIYAQIEAGIVELGPKPIPDVPVMAGPEPGDFGRGQNRYEPKFETNNFEARPFQANSFEQKPVEANKGVAPNPSTATPDWPDNPFAKPTPAQPKAAPKPQQGQWPQAQPASSPQQSSWPTGAGPASPFQATWPNAAPQTQPKPALQGARPNGPLPQSPQMPQAPWTANPSAQRPVVPQQPQGQAQPPRPQPRPAQAQTPPPRMQPQQPKPPSQADLQTAWQQAQQLEQKTRAQPVPPLPAQPLQEEQKPSRKRALLKWGVVLLLLAIMAVGGWLVLGHVKGSAGLQSSKPANLDPDDPRSRKADKLQGPS